MPLGILFCYMLCYLLYDFLRCKQIFCHFPFTNSNSSLLSCLNFSSSIPPCLLTSFSIFQYQLSPPSSSSLFNTSIPLTHFLFLYHISPLHSMHPSPQNFPLFSSPSAPPSPSSILSPGSAHPPPPPHRQRAWVWACFLSRQLTSACPHCEQGKYAPLCLHSARPSMWKWSECRLVNQSIEQTCLKPCPWNPSLLLFHAWQMS